MLGYFPGRIGEFRFKLDHVNWHFWRKVSRDKWEPETIQVLSNHLSKKSVYCDIGTWIGPTVLYASQKCERVIAFEPDPVAYKYLLSNLILNNADNVTPYNIALSNTTGVLEMASFGSRLGDSMTSLLKNRNKDAKKTQALVFDWNYAVNIFELEKIDVLKIDIEGGEFLLIPAMKDYLIKYKPIVWLSIHAPFLPENKRTESITDLINIMSCYQYCFNDKLEPIDIECLRNDKNMKEFPVFLFRD